MTGETGPSELGELVGEAKRRGVLRVAIVYAIVAVGGVAAAKHFFPLLAFPEWTLRLVVLVAVLGFPIALLLAWTREPASGRARDATRPADRPEPRPPGAARGTTIAANRWERFWQAYERASVAGEPAAEEPSPERRSLTGALLVLLLITGAVGVYAAVAAERGGEGGSSLPASRSIAVLPFADPSPGGRWTHVADGMAAEILDALARVGPLDVESRSSSFRFGSGEGSVRAAGDSLAAGYVLSGSLRIDGDRVRVAARLTRTEDGTDVWSESYVRPFSAAALFRVQEEIARSAAGAVPGAPVPGSETRLVAGRTEDLEAYERYLRARLLWHERSPASLRRAAELLGEAIERDPEFGRAQALLANVLSAPPGHGPDGSPTEAAARAREAAERALELDPDLHDAHAGLARALMWQRVWEEAERHYRRAIELGPRDPAVRAWYAWLLAARGRMDEALAEAHAGIKLDPFLPETRAAYAAMLLFNRRPEPAAAEYRRLEELRPDGAGGGLGRAIALSEAGRTEEALGAADRALRLDPRGVRARSTRAVVAVAAGDEESARRTLGELKGGTASPPGDASGSGTPVSRPIAERAFWVAGIHAALAEPDSAFAWLLRVEDLDGGARPARGWDDVTIARLRGLGRFDLIRSDPRYAALLSRLGVAGEE